MEKYTDMKFEGDLAFLNEHLELARSISNDAVNDNDKEGKAGDAEQTVENKNYFANNGNFAYNLTSQNIANAPSKWNFNNVVVDSKNDSQNFNTKQIADREEKIEKIHGSQNAKKTRNSPEVASSNEVQNTTKIAHSEKSNLLNSQNSDFDNSVVGSDVVSSKGSNDAASHDNQISNAQLEGLENDNSYHTADDVPYYDTYHNDDEEVNTTEFSTSDKSNTLDSQISDDVVTSVNTDKNSAKKSNDFSDYANQTSIAGSEGIESNNNFQSKDDFNYFDIDNNIDDDVNATKFEQSEAGSLDDSQNSDYKNNIIVSDELSLNSSYDSEIADNKEVFSMSENLEIDNRYEVTSNVHHIDEEQNLRDFNRAENTEVLDHSNTDLSHNRNDFLETILYEFNESVISNTEVNKHLPENLERDDSFQSRNEFYNSNLYNNNKFDQAEKMEKINNSQSNESLQNSRNFQDANSNKFNGSVNSQNLDHFAQIERLQNETNFRAAKNSKNIDFPNNRPHSDKSEKKVNPNEAQYSDNYQNVRNFQNPIQTKISGSENNQYRDTFVPKEKLKNNSNYQGTRNYKNSGEFENLNDMLYREQVTQPKKNGNIGVAPNTESFQSPRNFQDAGSNASSHSESQHILSNLQQRENLKNDNNFQSQRNYKNTDHFNNSDDLNYRTQFEHAEKIRDRWNTQHNESFQNPRDFQDTRSIRFDGSQGNYNSGNFSHSERLKNDSSFQVGNNFKNIDDFNKSKDLQYRNQFEHSEKTGNFRNISNDEGLQNSRNLKDLQANRFNGSDGIQNRHAAPHSEKLRNDIDFQGARSYTNTNEFNNNDDLYYRTQFEQPEKADNLRNLQNNDIYYSGSSVHHANDNQKTQNVNITDERDQFYNRNSRNDVQYMQNHNDMENPSNARYINDDNVAKNFGNIRYATGDYGISQAEINQVTSNNVGSKNIIDINTYPVNEFEVVQPSVSRRKSQLELMLLSSGFDMELFNNFKEELLELEKDNIIMKYKQDLMMTILKS